MFIICIYVDQFQYIKNDEFFYKTLLQYLLSGISKYFKKGLVCLVWVLEEHIHNGH